MLSKRELYEKAMLIISARRQQAVTEAKTRKAEICRAVPEIGALQTELANTGLRLTSLITRKSDDLPSQLERLKQENMRLNKEIQALLAAHGLPSDALTVHYTCKQCEDTGVAQNGRRCDCVTKLVNELATAELAGSSSLKLCDFSSFDLSYYPVQPDTQTGLSPRSQMENIYRYCYEYAKGFTLQSPSLFLLGNTGLGKTHLSLAIANAALQKGFHVVYGSASDLLRQVSDEYFSRETTGGKTLEIMMECDLLVLDDLGTEFESSFHVSTVYDLVNSRLNRSLPTIINSNLSLPELERKYSPRIVSRLMAQYECLRFLGTDIRKLQREMKKR